MLHKNLLKNTFNFPPVILETKLYKICETTVGILTHRKRENLELQNSVLLARLRRILSLDFLWYNEPNEFSGS